MKTRIRRTGRALAVGLGALALSVGATACSLGGDEESSTDTEVASEDTGADEDEAASDDGADDSTADDTAADDTAEDDAAASDDGADGAAADDAAADDAADDEESSDGATEASDEDLQAATDQVMGFFQALGDQDPEAACGFMLDPTTGEAMDGQMLDLCVSSIEESGQLDQFTPEMMDLITEDMMEAKDNGDGTITVTMAGASSVTMEQGSDGEWYIADSSMG